MNREQLGKALDAMGPRDDCALPRRDFMEIFRPTRTDRIQAVLDKVIEFTDSNFTELQNARNLCKQFIVDECIGHFVFYLKPEIEITVPIHGSAEVAKIDEQNAMFVPALRGRDDLKCPGCQTPLKRVRQTGGMMLNDDQFDAIKAGDFYCESCPGDRGKSGLRYFWKSELGITG